MRPRLLAISSLLILACALRAGPVDTARAATVLVDSGAGTGSGVVFKNGEVSFIWTDAHVVDSCQHTKTVIDPATGQPSVRFAYDDVRVGTREVEDGREVGGEWKHAHILKYSKAEDIALLVVYKKNYGSASAVFAAGAPKEGSKILHVGCFHGAKGANSVAEGVVASVGRLRRDFDADEKRGYPYDQISGVAHKGSSGGGVWDAQGGAMLGLVTEFLGGDYGGYTHGSYLITPARRLREFAKRHKVEFALEAKVKSPALADLLLTEPTVDPVDVPKDFPKQQAAPDRREFPPPFIPIPFGPREKEALSPRQKKVFINN